MASFIRILSASPCQASVVHSMWTTGIQALAAEVGNVLRMACSISI